MKIVEFWWAGLDLPGWRSFLPVLAADEQARAARFVFERDQRRFVVSHAMLRHVLARAAGGPPEQLQFTYGARGKPALAGDAAIHFNLAHSEEIAVIGIAREPLGVDVECIKRPIDDMEAIAARFFSASEAAELRQTPPEDRARAFFNCWTRKEAYVKAVGDGLYLPLNDFSVTLAPGEPPRMVTLGGDPDAAARWSLFHLEPAPGYVAAIAISGHEWSVSAARFEW